MKTRILIAIAFASGIISCADAQQKTPPLKTVTASASQNINVDFNPNEFEASAKEQKGLLLDVRTKEEFDAGHIPGAVNIDWYGADFMAEAGKIDKSKSVYVYCAAGGRSQKAKDKLNRAGFADVHNLMGGFDAWESAGKPVE